MKKIQKLFVVFLYILQYSIACAQKKIEYNLCNQDFRAISLRDSLPTNAIYTNTNATAEARAKDVLRHLTFEEKLTLTGGWNKMHFPALPRLGLRPIYFADASQGIHVKNICVKVGKTTSFPAVITLAATWDPELATEYAKSIGEECQAYGISVLLGPGMNMYRNAEGGRNFEYFGEDPFLASRFSVKYVQGLQSTGTMATIKHFIGNEYEFARHATNVKVSERALREIYLPPYEASIKVGNALAVMTGNNFINGYPGAANTPLVMDVLRKEYGFKGIVMSDWANSNFWVDRQNLELTSGHSLLMENNEIFATYVKQEIQAHPEKKALMEKQLDAMVFENLYAFFKAGDYDKPYRDPALLSTFDAHRKVALQVAEEGITLLKNENNILPVAPSSGKKIVVLGSEQALNVAGGTGSGAVEGFDHTSYLEGLRKIYGDKIVYDKNISQAEIAAADVVFYFVTRPSGEGFDVDFNLPDIKDSVNLIAGLNKNLVLIHSGGNGYAMPWLPKVKGFVFAYLLGQVSGEAMANVISGNVNPSGKLPFTIEKEFSQSPAFEYNKMPDGKYYWGGNKPHSQSIKDKFGIVDMPYTEGVYIGYRWYEKKNIEPQFPFGFGLSYTSFSMSPITASSDKVKKDKPVVVTVSVTNTGKVAGAEVVQLYVKDLKSSIDRPLKELKGFKKVFLQPGETIKVYLTLDWKSLAFWGEKQHRWKVEPGDFEIEMGFSSQDIKQKKTVLY